MIHLARKYVIQKLWEDFKKICPPVDQLKLVLGTELPLDHLAILDLPSHRSGMETMRELFEIIGFRKSGYGTLDDKANQFYWMCEEDSHTKNIGETLPQVVVTDFMMEHSSPGVRKIISHYAETIPDAPTEELRDWAKKARAGDDVAAMRAGDCLYTYISKANAKLPTYEEYMSVKNENELMSWTLVHGKTVNHFGLAVHSLRPFHSLSEFLGLITTKTTLPLKKIGNSLIAGDPSQLIEQASVLSAEVSVLLENHEIKTPGPFFELVWRQMTQLDLDPALWKNYFNDFVPRNATQIAESLLKES